MIDILPINPSPDDMARHVNVLAEDSHNIIITNHARERMEQRNITRRHVVTCLRKGRVAETPYKSVKGDWRCSVVRTVSGMDVSVQIAIDFKEQLIVVTVF